MAPLPNPFEHSVTKAQAVHTQDVRLNTAQAAIFQHPHLAAVRQSLEAEIRRLHNVECTFSSLPCTNQSLSVDGLTVQVS